MNELKVEGLEIWQVSLVLGVVWGRSRFYPFTNDYKRLRTAYHERNKIDSIIFGVISLFRLREVLPKSAARNRFSGRGAGGIH